VEHRIIRGKGSKPEAPARMAQSPPREAPPSVRNVRIDSGSAGQRLDNFLTKVLKGVPRTHLYRVIRSGEVRVNKGRASADTRLDLGDEVRIPPMRTADRSDEPAAPPREFPVVLEDEHLLAIDKPAGVAVHGGSGESFGVIEQLRRARPDAAFLELVHRLDKETSGLLLVAKKRPALVALQSDLRSRSPERAMGKTYAALVAGAWPESLKVIDVALHKYVDAEGTRRVRAVDADADEGRRSITLVKVADRFARFSLLDVTIKTGRTHQIRVHLADAGHVVVGDPKYGDFALNRELARGLAVPGTRFDRMFLHARRLRFVHPASGEAIEIEAPLPDACSRLLEALPRATGR
jgi:23S rRNA pseudouridine955/2504/2580 synthase